MANRFTIEAVFKAINKVTAPVSRMQNSVLKFTRSAEANFRRLNRVVSKFSKSLKNGLKQGAVSLVAFGFALTRLLKPGVEFEQAITNVGAVSLKTRDQIQDLEKMALQLGRTTKFTATQAANAMEVMARAGFKNNEILAATPAVLAAAAASGLEIAEVANVVSNALKGMGLEANQAARVADVLTLASSKTNSTIGSLGESLKNISATARQLNIPLEDTVAAIALLQDVGLDASMAGTAFNTMLTKMAAPTVGMQKKMKRFGISFKDAKGDMLPLQKVLEQLNIASAKAGGNFDKVAFLAELVGLRGQKAAANLGNMLKEGKLEKLTKQLEKATGSAKKMADIRMNTVQGSLLLLKSAVDAVSVKIFDLNGGPLKQVIDNLTKWVGENEKLIASRIGEFLLNLVSNLESIVIWVKRIGIALAVFFTFSALLKTITLSMIAFNLIVGLNPFVLMTAGVIALTTALTTLLLQFEAVQNLGARIGEGLFNLLNDDIGAEITKSTPSGSRVISPQERVAQSVEEKRTTSTAEVTIKAGDNTKAEVTKGKLGTGLNLQPTGAM